jgi:transcriptional regulator with XRE-family HTH domain
MTQLDLAGKLGVTDKAVSKWDGDLSYPDINSIPKLAEVLGVSVDELMQIRQDTEEISEKNTIANIVDIALKDIGLAMGIGAVVLSILNQIETQSAIGMLGIGLACAAAASLKNKQN